MRSTFTIIKGALGGAAFLLSAAVAGAASAATVDFGTSGTGVSTYTEDGFTFAPARIVSGNCLEGACLALNPNETTTLTFAGGGSFTLESLSFNLLGQPSELTLTGSNDATTTFTTALFGHNTYNTVDFGDLFTDVTSVVFDNTGRGNVRIDNIDLTGPDAAPIPLPAAGLLLLGGLGSLGLIRRQRRLRA